MTLNRRLFGALILSAPALIAGLAPTHAQRAPGTTREFPQNPGPTPPTGPTWTPTPPRPDGWGRPIDRPRGTGPGSQPAGVPGWGQFSTGNPFSN